MKIMICAGIVVGAGLSVLRWTSPLAFGIVAGLLLSAVVLLGLSAVAAVTARRPRVRVVHAHEPTEIRNFGTHDFPVTVYNERSARRRPATVYVPFDRELAIGTSGASYRYELYDATGRVYRGTGQPGVTLSDSVQEPREGRVQYARLTVYDRELVPQSSNWSMARFPGYEIEQ